MAQSQQSQWRRFQFFDKGWAAATRASRTLAEALRTEGEDSAANVVPDAAAFAPARQALPGLLFFGDVLGRVSRSKVAPFRPSIPIFILMAGASMSNVQIKAPR